MNLQKQDKLGIEVISELIEMISMENNDHDLNTSLHNILYYFNPRKLVKYSSGSRFRSGNKNEGSWPQISCLFEGALVALTSDSPSKILSYTVCVEAKLDESQ